MSGRVSNKAVGHHKRSNALNIARLLPLAAGLLIGAGSAGCASAPPVSQAFNDISCDVAKDVRLRQCDGLQGEHLENCIVSARSNCDKNPGEAP